MELNQNGLHARNWVQFENTWPKSRGFTKISLQNRGPKTIFNRRLRNFTASLTAYIFGAKHDIHNRPSALQATRVSYTVSKRHELWPTNGLKLDLHFSHYQSAIEKLGSSVPKKLVAKSFYVCSVFRRFRDLTANVFWTKHAIDNRAKDIRKQEWSPTLSQNFMNFGPQTAKIGPEFFTTLCKFCVFLRCQASQTEVSKRIPTKLFQTEGGKWSWCE